MSSFLDLHSLYPMNQGFHFSKFSILVVLKRAYIYSFYVSEYQHFPFGQDAPNIFSIFTCSCKRERVLSDKLPETSREGNNPLVTFWGFKKKSRCKVYTQIWLSTWKGYLINTSGDHRLFTEELNLIYFFFLLIHYLTWYFMVAKKIWLSFWYFHDSLGDITCKNK